MAPLIGVGFQLAVILLVRSSLFVPCLPGRSLNLCSDSVEEVLARWETYAAPSSIVRKDEKTQVLALTHEVLRLFADECSTVVAHAFEKAVLQSLSVDGTPIKVKQTLTAGGVRGKNVRRRVGQDSLELLYMVTWLRYMTATAPVFGCASEFQTTLREQGHRGIAVEHAVMDRALFSSIWRKQKQRVLLSHHKLATPESGMSCAAHDARKSLQWGLASHLSNADLLRDVCIVMESIRNSYSSLASVLLAWIGEKLVRVLAVDDVSAKLAVCQFLGVDPDTTDLLCEMQLQFVMDEICVSAVYNSAGSDVVADVSLCFLSVLRVREVH
eukprot:5310239-Amphidinium_carterae.1